MCSPLATRADLQADTSSLRISAPQPDSDLLQKSNWDQMLLSGSWVKKLWITEELEENDVHPAHCCVHSEYGWFLSHTSLLFICFLIKLTCISTAGSLRVLKHLKEQANPLTKSRTGRNKKIVTWQMLKLVFLIMAPCTQGSDEVNTCGKILQSMQMTTQCVLSWLKICYF